MSKAKHVNKEKAQAVAQITALAKKYPIVAVVNVEGLPTPQLQTMRESLRGSVEILMTKKRLIRIMFDKVKADKAGIEVMSAQLKGMPALLFTTESPFKLYKTLQQKKSNAPAKAGQIAPRDIVVPAGPTGFAPGPVIGELGAIGIKAGIDAGKVVIKQNATVTKEGQTITPQVAAMLSRLNILPMEVGLDLVAAYENGLVYDRNVLSVDEKQYVENLVTAHRWATNLAVEAGVYTPETTTLLIAKAHTQSRALALSQAIMAEGVKELIIAKAEAQARSVDALIEQ